MKLWNPRNRTLSTSFLAALNMQMDKKTEHWKLNMYRLLGSSVCVC